MHIIVQCVTLYMEGLSTNINERNMSYGNVDNQKKNCPIAKHRRCC